MPLCRPNRPGGDNLAERGIGDVRIRISIADDIEGIERLEAETDRLLLVRLKVLKDGHIHVQVTRSAHSSIARTAEGVGSGYAEGAHSIVDAGCGAWGRRRVGTKPIDKGAMNDLQLTVLVGAGIAITVGIVSGAGNGLRESGPCDTGCRKLPTAQRLIH